MREHVKDWSFVYICSRPDPVCSSRESTTPSPDTTSSTSNWLTSLGLIAAVFGVKGDPAFAPTIANASDAFLSWVFHDLDNNNNIFWKTLISVGSTNLLKVSKDIRLLLSFPDPLLVGIEESHLVQIGHIIEV